MHVDDLVDRDHAHGVQVTDDNVIDDLRAIRAGVDKLANKIDNLDVRMDAIKQAITLNIATVNQRLARVETRLDRIERRLDQVEAPLQP